MQDIKAKYSANYAIVTGATGGVGKEISRQLIERQINVIAVCRNLNLGNQLATDLASEKARLIVVQYDFASQPVDEFGQFLEIELALKKIPLEDIGLCWVNAGYAQIKPFEELEFVDHEKFLQTNMMQYLALAHWYSRLHVTKRNGKKSALIMTGSMNAYVFSPYGLTYCISKAFISDLALAMHVEFKNRGLDVLAVHPTAISGTKFHTSPGTCPTGVQLLEGGKKIDETPMAVPPRQVVTQAFCRVGKRIVTRVGNSTRIVALISCLGKEVQGKLFTTKQTFEDMLQPTKNYQATEALKNKKNE